MLNVGAFSQDAPLPVGSPPASSRCRTTRWSVVFAASGDGQSARAALGRLYGLYWFPVYTAIARRRGVTDAAELAQAFLSDLLVFRGDLKRVQRLPGQRFRGWLFRALGSFLKNQWKFERRQCRDKRLTVSYDASPDEAPPPSATVAAPLPSPEQRLQRARAMDLITDILGRLRREYSKNAAVAGVDAEQRFEALKIFLPGPCTEQADYADCAARLGMSPDAVKQLVHRLRTRFGQLLHETLREMVSSDAEVAAAKRWLCEALEVPPPDGEADLDLITHTLGRLRREYCENAAVAGVDAEQRFEALTIFLAGPCTEQADYADCAARLGMSPDAVRQLVHRLRARFAQLLHEALSEKVSSDAEPPPDGEAG